MQYYCHNCSGYQDVVIEDGEAWCKMCDNFICETDGDWFPIDGQLLGDQ